MRRHMEVEKAVKKRKSLIPNLFTTYNTSPSSDVTRFKKKSSDNPPIQWNIIMYYSCNLSNENKKSFSEKLRIPFAPASGKFTYVQK